MSDDQQSPLIERRNFLRLLGFGASVPVLAQLTACSSGGGGALGPAGGGGKVTELVVATNESPWLEAYQKVASQYSAQSGIQVTLRVFPYDGLRTQMVNAIQNQTQVFDVFQLDEPWTHQFYDSGWVKPLDAIKPGYKLDPQILTYDALPYWDDQARTSAPSGEVMGLPLNGNVHLLIYRTDLYEELGLSAPRTWEEAIRNGQEAMRQKKAKYGYVTRGQGVQGGQSITYDYMPVFYSYGANWFADEGTDWTPTVTSPQAVKATQVYKQLLDLGPADPQSVGQSEVIALLQSGEALQGHVVAAAAPQMEDKSASNVAGRMGYAVVPAGDAGPAPTSGTWSLCVPANAPDNRAKAAFDYINWMLQQQQQASFSNAGGIATRKDILSQAANQAGVDYLKPTLDSMPDVHRAVRYVFSAPMLDATESVLSAIGAGKVEVETGLGQLEQQLTKIVSDAGFLNK